MAVKWLDQPEAHDYDAAADYLSLGADDGAVAKTVDALKTAEPMSRRAKDILRAAQLALLPENNPRVRTDLAKIGDGRKFADPAGAWGLPNRSAVADRRRLPPRVRQLSDRREHPDPVPARLVAVLTV